jgi:proline iminopeptidase
MAPAHGERWINIGDTRLYVRTIGRGFPLMLLHGGPGLDHRMFGDYLDPLASRFQLVYLDQRGQGRSDPAPPETLTLANLAADVSRLASALGFDRYSVLGHSFGAFVALQHAVDHPAAAAGTIVSSGLPSERFLAAVDLNLAAFEPIELRQQVTDSWAREQHVTLAEEVEQLLVDQLPFHFADPLDPRIAEYASRTAGAHYSPQVLRHFARQGYGGIALEDRLSGIPQPVLIMAGRKDRTCTVEAAEVMASQVPHSDLVIYEHSGHMTFVEETPRYLETVAGFLDRGLSTATASD